jgi:chromosomal replication initiation ATPase DnaA
MKRELSPIEKQKLESLVKLASNYVNMPYEAAFERTRKTENVTIRQASLMVYFEIKDSYSSLEQIGNFFKLDHSSIIHNLKKAKGFYENELKFRQMINYLRHFALTNLDIVFPYKTGFGNKEMINFAILGI